MFRSRTTAALGAMRRNALACVALFVALGGSAYAAATVGPADIENDAVRTRHIAAGHVRPADLATGAVTGAKIRNDTVRARDVAGGAVGTQEIRNGRVVSADVANDSLTGADIDESTLSGSGGGAPASAAVNGCCVGLENTPGDPVAETTITTSQGARVMATAVVELVTNGGGDDEAFCEIRIDGDNDGRQYTQTGLPDGLSDNGGETVSLSLAKDVAAGAHTVAVVCFEGLRTSSEVFVEDYQLMAWEGAA